MKTKIITIMLGMVFLLNIVGALSVVAGEPISMTLEEEYDYYSIVGNSTPIELDIVQNGLELTITFNKYQKEDTFELIFFNKEKETITVYQSSGGGGGTRTIYKDREVKELVPYYITNETIIDNSEPIIPEEESSKRIYWIMIISIVILLGLLITVIIINRD